MNVFDEEEISEKIVSSYIRALKAGRTQLWQKSRTEMMEEKSATIQLLEGRYSLKDIDINDLTYGVNSALESEIYRLANQKEIAIAEDKMQWSTMELDEIKKKVCPELAKNLPTIIDNVEVMGKKLADLKK